MAGRKKREPGRGWSMVFEDRTKRTPNADDTELVADEIGSDFGSPDATVAQPLPPALEQEIAEARQIMEDELTDEAVLDNSPVLRPPAEDEADPPTLIDPNAIAELERSLGNRPSLDDPAGLLTPAGVQEGGLSFAYDKTMLSPTTGDSGRYTSTEPDLSSEVPTPNELNDTLLPGDYIETTRKARVARPGSVQVTPVYSDDEPLTPAATDPEFPPRTASQDPILAEPRISSQASAKAKSRKASYNRTKPEVPEGSPEHTMIDLAAALGMAPEPADAEPELHDTSEDVQPEADVPAPRKPLMRRNSIERDMDALLAPPEDNPQRASPPRATPSLGAFSKGPSEGLQVDQLRNLADTTSNLARIIPIIIVLFVVVATIIISLQLFKPKPTQRHVELRFLTIGGNRPGARLSEITKTPIVIETVPPGVLVLFNRNIVGKTPIRTDLPIEVDDNVAIELSSPYFERWLAEVKPDNTGEYRIEVELQSKR